MTFAVLTKVTRLSNLEPKDGLFNKMPAVAPQHPSREHDETEVRAGFRLSFDRQTLNMDTPEPQGKNNEIASTTHFVLVVLLCV